MADLAGKRIVVTRPQDQCQKFLELLQSRGAVPFCFPVIEISPLANNPELDNALRRLADYDWLILTSVNGVAVVWEHLQELDIQYLPSALKIACIGPKTAAALAKHGFQADFVPEEYIAEAILPGLGELEDIKVLLTRADIARPDLPEAIRAGGGTADDISTYRTLLAEPDETSLVKISAGTDLLTFTSPSTVENFFQIITSAGLDPLHLPGNPIVACIGPITARAAEKKGYRVTVLPEKYTIEGLLDAIIRHYSEKTHEQK